MLCPPYLLTVKHYILNDYSPTDNSPTKKFKKPNLQGAIWANCPWANSPVVIFNWVCVSLNTH